MNKRKINKMFRDYNRLHPFKSAFESHICPTHVMSKIDTIFSNPVNWIGMYSNASLYCFVEDNFPFFYNFLNKNEIQFDFHIGSLNNSLIIMPYNTEAECLRVVKKLVKNPLHLALIDSILEHMKYQKSYTTFDFKYNPSTDEFLLTYHIFSSEPSHSFSFRFEFANNSVLFDFNYRQNKKQFSYNKFGNVTFREFFMEAIEKKQLNFFQANELSDFNTDLVELACLTEIFNH